MIWFIVEGDRIGVHPPAIVFQLQIGVTRISRGGRVIPRNARGQLVQTQSLTAIEREVVETYRLATPSRSLIELPLTRIVLAVAFRTVVTPPPTPNAVALKSRRALAKLAGTFVPTHVRGRSFR